MQREIDAAPPATAVRIVGINETGQESGNATISEGHLLPWLQDTAAAGVWALWAVNYRDVIILDEENRRLAVFNLTEHNLAIPARYDSLKAMLLDAAR